MNDEAAPQLPAPYAFHGLVGRSGPIRAVFDKIRRYGAAQASVLITGETGTGKEIVARALHAESARARGPWVALNCSALNEELFESELFGHERGSFTGALSLHKGRFERADGGTLFLDEVGDMPMRVQSKLLRVLEDGTFERVGGERELRSDVRIVAATNVPLERAVAERRFREDLFHRVAVLRVHVPALRDRFEDLPLLVRHFLDRFNLRYGKFVSRLSPEAMRLLEDYRWPGNVRELRNVLERVYVETQSEVIGRNAFAEWESERDLLAAGAWDLDLRDEQRLASRAIVVPIPVREGERVPAPRVVDLRQLVEDGAVGFPLAPFDPQGGGPRPAPRDDEAAPRIIDLPVEAYRTSSRRSPGKLTAEEIREAYRRAEGNVTRAARLLGIHKTTLYRNLERLGLDRGELEAGP